MKRPLAVVWVIALVVSGCASSLATAPDARKASDPNAEIAKTGIAPGVVDGQAAHRLVAAGITVIDVRTSAEFDSGHVPGAVNIPYDEMPRRYDEIGPPSTPVLVYCKTGRRSGFAIATLRDKGFTRIYDLGSYDSWAAVDAAPAPR